MQFITNGPDIPEALLQAHEDGRVVFFCGAGISYKVGLKDFKWLVDEIYRRCGTSRDNIEEAAYVQERYDIALHLLEGRLPGQRSGLAMRQKLADALTPDLNINDADSTHNALLHLSQDRKGIMRLVTTNFDRAFEQVRHRLQINCNIYAAPMLPIPKNSQWDGLVYLHGLIPEKNESEKILDKLVVTSGDFGLAYLVERWAARFVSELFRNFVVCFVGYSINDPVLRYMMDALAAERLRGEVAPAAYMIASFTQGNKEKESAEWNAKGVIPILYDSANVHVALHNTLRVWADNYTSGIQGKERIVVENAIANPVYSTKEDDFVGRTLWALSHISGLPAKLFADLNPVPPIEWLKVFSEERYSYPDLSRFGVTCLHAEVDKTFRFSFIRRPAPMKHSSFMSLVSGGCSSSEWDDVMLHLARWMLRHLNDPALIIWLAQRGGHLHDQLKRMIGKRIDDLASKTPGELEEIRSNAPNAIPGSLMLPLWNLFLADRVKSFWHKPGLYRWVERLKYDGRLTATMRFELRELLALKMSLKKPFHFDGVKNIEEATRIQQLVNFEYNLSSDHVRSLISHIAKERWQMVLPELLDEFQFLLRDALDLMNEFGEADERKDSSFLEMPSISEHWQNRGFKDWVVLIEFLRDAWLATLKKDARLARRIAQRWFDIPYLTFKRLALFAASQDNGIEPQQWVEWLVSDNGFWLWSTTAHREVMRLLALQGGSLTMANQEGLENAILSGPPSESFEDEYREFRIDRSVWLRLAKLNASGLVLGAKAEEHLTSLSAKHPDWKLEPHEREEFIFWMSGSDDPDYEEKNRQVDIAPHSLPDLVEWLKCLPQDKESAWRNSCRAQFCHSLCALSNLSKEGIWREEQWRVALQVWSEERFLRRSWQYASSMVSRMNDAFIGVIAHSLAWWINEISKSIDRDGDIFLNLCRRVLALPFESPDGNSENNESVREPVSEAINHPVGHVTQALINRWFATKPNDNELLLEPFKSIFSHLCDAKITKYRHGRVLLASNLVALFRVDPEWTKKHLLPFFNWDRNSVETIAVWRGFLWSPRIFRPLLIELKHLLLSTANHYDELGEFSGQYSAFLTYVALGSIDGFSSEDFQKTIAALPPEGLQKVAWTLKQALEGAGDQRETYWRNKVRVFWQEMWPKHHELRTEELARTFALLCVEAVGEFPSALSDMEGWLMPIKDFDYIVMRLCESGLCVRFPAEALRFLDLIFVEQSWLTDELGKCLEAIVKAKPEFERDHRYQKLLAYVRKNS